MSFQRKLFARLLGLVGLLLVHFSSRAQDFGLVATASPNSVLVGNPILYTIAVTNTFGFGIDNVFVTNFYGSAVFNGATNNLVGTIITNSTGTVFRINTFIAGAVARLTLSLNPVGAGSFTNQITVAAFNRINAGTNIITQVNFPAADLAVGMTNAAAGVLTNDTTVISLLVTNLGPNAASGVVLSNALPTSFKLLSVSPAGADYTFGGGMLALNLGTLASGSSTQLLVSVQPTNAGTFNLTASVSAANILDPNFANSAVTNRMVVATFSGNLEVVAVSQHFNLQTGLLEERARVTNTNATDVQAARVIASGLPVGARLYNASGTNGGNAYVHYNAPLVAGNGVDLVLEYYVLKVSTFTKTLSAFGVPAINLSAPTNSGAIITRKAYSSGGFLIEFPATIGKTYTIAYSSNASFSNPLIAQPSIVAPATQVQWIDNGPPKTLSHPSNTVQRFYRVFPAQ